MKKTRRTTERIIRILRDAASSREKTGEVCNDKAKRPWLDREPLYTLSE